jgi:hypothetical protein
MWSDNETDVDLIGFHVHAELIKALVLDKTLLPVTIGVFGDWGNGKSSIMKMLQTELITQEDKGVLVLYFNGWIFEGYDDAKAALMETIITDLSGHNKFGQKIAQEAKGLMKQVDWMRMLRWGLKDLAPQLLLTAVTGGAAVGGLVSTVASAAVTTGNSALTEDETLGGILKPNKEGDATIGFQSIRKFREAFEALLSAAGIEQLIVLIDDLDRCSPDRIVDNLEAIKLFLNVKGSAFVIGADPRIVRQAIAIRYGQGFSAAQASGVPQADAEDREQIVADYLEKVIQIPYYLPRLHAGEIEVYMNLLFCKRELNEDQFNKCVAHCAALREEDRNCAFNATHITTAIGVPVPPKLLDKLNVTKVGGQLIAECLKGNPRQVKRFLNAFFVRSRLAEAAKFTHFRPEIMIKLMILEYSEPTLFRDLNSMVTTSTAHTFLKELEAGDGHAEKPEFVKWERLSRWAKLEPALGTVDLSDYFWLARDRLQGQLNNVNLIPPLLRRLHDQLLLDLRVASLGEVKKLELDESAILFELLSKTLITNPSDIKPYEAYTFLVRSKIPGSDHAFLATLERVPIRDLNPSVGLVLPQLDQTIFKALIDRIKADPSDTPIGRVFKPKKKK